MYLKSLVLKGFKSFADRSALTLEPGITAVVGPNGSGKSNISDAVLWVLGERNAKNLRGQVMEDVIFAGSSARKSVGVAEVDLVLDNSDGSLPVDYDEVAITRRMYRSGESEYLINGALARRMDVLDILHDSGLGTGTHSIISQGNLDSILQSKPEDRRALIEEAAGVLKHKQRKAKSERKLEQMDQHLARVRDVVSEVSRQLGPLERKAKRALAYQGLSAELAEASLQLAVDDLRVLQRQWDAAAERERALAAEVDAKREAITAAEAASERLQELIRQQSAGAVDISRQHRRASSAVERLESSVRLLQEKRRAGEARIAELEASIAAGEARRTAAEAELARAREQLAEATARHAAAAAEVGRLDESHGQARARRAKLDGELSELQRTRRDAEQRAERARRELAAAQEQLADGQGRMRLIESHGQQLASRLEQARADSAARMQAAEAAAAELADLVGREAQAREQAAAAKLARAEARSALDAAQDAKRALAAEIRGIEEIERAQARSAGAARAWLEEQADGAGRGLSPLGHEVKAEPGYEALVERLLGSDVTALLARDAARAREVGEALSEQGREGEVVLVLREDGQGPAAGMREAGRAAAAQAGCDALLDHVSYPPAAARAVEALLGDVAVCPDVPAAFAAHEADRAGARYVTRSGCIVWPSGKVTFGDAVDEGAEGVLARARKLDGARRRHEEASRALEESEQAFQAAEAASTAAQDAALLLSQELASLRGRAAAAQNDAKAAADQLAAVMGEQQDIARQQAEAAAAVSAAQPEVERLAAQVRELDAALAQARERIAHVQDDVMPAREEEARLGQELADAKLSAATLSERENYARRMAEARERDLAELSSSRAESRRQLSVRRTVCDRVGPLSAVLEGLSASARRRAVMLEDAAAAAQDSSAGMHVQANEARAAAHGAHEAFDEANGRLSETRVEKGRLEVQVEAAVNVIVGDCGTPLETALALPALEDRAEVEAAAFKLRRRIANMGTINPDAAEEYEQLKARYDYLTAQLADLDSARSALAKINRVIDARMKDDFVTTFQAVNENFKEIFAVLFPGGTAELSLVDPDDLEHTGVEVTAQPRGKRITKMMLMSGGEKSLVALALLFAVYRIRTTPFYILDEVEAALDDSNLRRLIAYLAELRDTTQLIMITHQRRTMEMADVLFGVSMQADGVTKVISQKLDRALQYAEG